MIDHGHELSSACVTKLEIDDETQGADDAPAASRAQNCDDTDAARNGPF